MVGFEPFDLESLIYKRPLYSHKIGIMKEMVPSFRSRLTKP